jgi:Ni,Fe-hydrogenase III large subunit
LVGTGTLRPGLAARFAAGGVVGRASGRPFDARRCLPNAPYDQLAIALPVFTEGDVDARVRVRVAELKESIGLVRAIFVALVPGAIHTPLPQRAGEGIAVVEGFRGEIVTWMALDRPHATFRLALEAAADPHRTYAFPGPLSHAY